MESNVCPNCEHELNNADKYCPSCGQKTNDELTINVLFSNTITNYFSVDARFFKSVPDSELYVLSIPQHHQRIICYLSVKSMGSNVS